MFQKTSLLRLACAFALCSSLAFAFTFNSNATNNKKSHTMIVQQKELILEIVGLNTKNHAAVRKAIEDNDGVTFRDYCFSNNTIMYVIDRDVLMDNQFIDDALAPFNLTYFVKEGSITQVQAACTDTPLEENPTE